MNTPCWEAGGWTALVGGNPTEPIGRSRVNDIEHVAIGNRVGRRQRSYGSWREHEAVRVIKAK
ncbi:MAG TPA: hypothetical protein VF878_01640 [Candidatus Udaeobacter sp.]